MFAKRSIRAGELILDEHPVLIIPEHPLPRDTPAWDNLGSNLPEKERVEMLAMANCRSREECPSSVEGIVRTNGLLLDLTQGKAKQKKSHLAVTTSERSQKFGGVFFKINRCNHSCGPNAAHKWVMSNLSSKLYALRDIEIGKEITSFYTDVTRSRDIRRMELERNHRFTCACPHCSPVSLSGEKGIDEVVIQESDDIRHQLRNWLSTRPSYLKWSTDLCRADDTVISSHLLALSLIEKEKMHFLQHIFIEELAMSYAILGNDEKFEFWAKEFIQKCGVEDQERAKEFKSWLEDRRKCRKWAWREKQRQISQCFIPYPMLNLTPRLICRAKKGAISGIRICYPCGYPGGIIAINYETTILTVYISLCINVNQSKFDGGTRNIKN
jgi:hypothetical protein